MSSWQGWSQKADTKDVGQESGQSLRWLASRHDSWCPSLCVVQTSCWYCVVNSLAEAHASAIFISAMLLTLVAVEVRELCRRFQISQYRWQFWIPNRCCRLPDSMDGLCWSWIWWSCNGSGHRFSQTQDIDCISAYQSLLDGVSKLVEHRNAWRQCWISEPKSTRIQFGSWFWTQDVFGMVHAVLHPLWSEDGVETTWEVFAS